MELAQAIKMWIGIGIFIEVSAVAVMILLILIWAVCEIVGEIRKHPKENKREQMHFDRQPGE